MQGKVATEVSQNFVREVQKKADLFNIHGPRLKVLISGRELAVQSNVHEFRRPEQILHVLPYYVSDDQRKTFTDPQNRLAQDQRQSWWAAYGKASGNGYTAMPDVLNRDELVDITSQPLLNYLVALSFARGNVDFAKESNLNVIYEDLLRAVHQRVWAEYPHPALKGIDEGQFFRILEEIALAAWHGDGRTTTVREIEAHCEQSGLKALLERFQEGASQGVTRLLLAFYFRQAGHRVSGDKTFEFTHKSFGEYLTARRIVRGVQLMHDELARRREYIESGWDERGALTYWANLCGPTTMDRYIFKFLCNEVSLRNQSQVKQWQETLCHLIGFMLRNGMPMERLEPRPVFLEETRQSRNAEEALLATVNAGARFTETVSVIDWPSETAFGEWISRLQGQRTGGGNVLSLECLGYIVANLQVLNFRDFHGAIFFRADLNQSQFIYASFRFASLRGAELQDTVFAEANLRGIDLEGANLEGANLQGANLQRANLQAANLQGAYLGVANLRGANLQRANLQAANLQGANLENATWTNGKRCLAGSIGKCIQEPDKPTKKKSRR
ncbi:MAG: pentapeptide repeat-containing protein [Blastocatellia bacterium]